MLRARCLAIALLIGVTLAGCGQSCQKQDAWIVSSSVSPAGHRADLASALLFDRYPGVYSASDFTYRSDWPSTSSFYSPGQVIYFTEHFVDIQNRGFGHRDYTYRRFDTVRSGVGYR